MKRGKNTVILIALQQPQFQLLTYLYVQIDKYYENLSQELFKK
jgi:hypothetical protein